MRTDDRLTGLLSVPIEDLGYELLGVERLGGSGAVTVRLYIDHPDGISVDDCERVSHQVSGVLDVEDPIGSAYTLEVSSPGVDRPLFSAAQCARFVGEEIALTLGIPLDGRRKFTGRLLEVDGENLHVEHEGEGLVVPFEQVQRARLKPDWSAL